MLTAIIAVCITDEPRTDTVYEEIVSLGIKHPDIVLRQAIVETGWFKCHNCSMDRNNLFGWYYKGKYLRFNTWQESIAYYKRWQDRHYKGGDYYKFLERKRFAMATGYVRTLKRVKL